MFFFFNDTATTEIYTLSLHDALPIWRRERTWSPLSGSSLRCSCSWPWRRWRSSPCGSARSERSLVRGRSEEHTSELQSRQYLVCRLLLEKKKKYIIRRVSYSHPSLCI